jgi:hypothetical protein
MCRRLPIQGACEADRARALLAHWRLDEESGTSARDDSGHGFDATLRNGGTWTAGQRGGALTLDGSDDYLLTPITVLPTRFSFALWFRWRPDVISTCCTPIVSKFSVIGDWIPISLWIHASTDHGLDYNRAFTESSGRWASPPIEVGIWHHVVVTHDSSSPANEVLLYLDGALAPLTAVDRPAGYPNDIGTKLLAFGTFDDDPNAENPGYFPGDLDEIMLFDDVLSPAEVMAIFGDS